MLAPHSVCRCACWKSALLFPVGSHLVRHVVTRGELVGQNSVEARVLVAAQVPRAVRNFLRDRAAVLVDTHGPGAPTRLLIVASAREVADGRPVPADVAGVGVPAAPALNKTAVQGKL